MIFVTGGAGFIGSNFIIDWLESVGEPVLNIDKLTYAGNLENLTELEGDSAYAFVKGDIANSELIEKLLLKYKPRAIVNFAAESHVDRSIYGATDFINTNVIGTFSLLNSALEFWKKLSEKDKNSFRFVHISTDEVYGSLEPSDKPFTEKHRYEPNSPYSASKASSDHLVRAWYHTYGFPTITTNCSNNYGPYHFPEKLIPLVIVSALDGKQLPIYGDGKQIRDWLYVKDHCSAIRRVLESGIVGETYNIGGWNEKTNIEVVLTICEMLDKVRPRKDGESYKNQIAYVKDRLGHDRRYAIDASKIEKELGWKPEETFETGIKKTVNWYLDNPNWVRNVRNGSYMDWIMTQYDNLRKDDN